MPVQTGYFFTRMAGFTLALVFASLSLAAGSCTDGSESCADAQSPLSVQRSTVATVSQLEHQLRSGKEAAIASTMSQEFARAAKTMPTSATKGLFESFKICGKCQTFERFGEAHDGGYLMCMDGLAKGSETAAYSLGVEKHDQWSEDVASKLGLTVNQFDCTVEVSATRQCKSCKFFKKCVVAADGKHPVPGHESEGWSLSQTLKETGQSNAAEGSLLMKMDIESSEWPIYASEPPDALKKFGQLIVEFHNLSDEGRHAEYLQAMTHIKDAGFQVAHLHGNNFEGMYNNDGLTIPNVLEVTFVHGNARPNGCNGYQEYDDALDAPNRAGHGELPMAHMG